MFSLLSTEHYLDICRTS